jgi:phenylacetate-CoA ligase
MLHPLHHAVFGATHRLRGSRSLEIFREIRKTPGVSLDEAKRLQMERLRELLEHAASSVPYYREVFRDRGLSPRDIRSVEDLALLPVLTKEIVRERADDLVSERANRARLMAHHSGGSTGVPLTFYRDPEYVDASMAGTYRNLSLSGWRPGEMIAFFWGWNDALNRMAPWKFELRQWMRRMYQFDPFRSGPEEMDAWARRWSDLRPRVVLGYASTIARFAEHLERTSQRVEPVRGVFTTAEKLYPQQRAVISRVFGCPVFDCYGSSEVQNIATGCAHGRMHVNADYVVVEVDETAGGPGPTPLLVTSLWNRAMPFIRYRNEDCGGLLEGGCECGSGFPLMDLSVSRRSDNFVLPGGRVVHGEFFTHLMYGTRGISSFQFHQVELDRIVLSLVPGHDDAGGTGRERAVQSAVEQIDELTGGTVRLEIRVVDSIPLSSAGKHRFTRSDVSEIGQPA